MTEELCACCRRPPAGETLHEPSFLLPRAWRRADGLPGSVLPDPVR